MNVLHNFELVMTKKTALLPKRSTKESAGYDIFSPKEVVIPKGGTATIELPFSFQGEEKEDVHIWIFVRSSFGIKKSIRLIEKNKKTIPGILLDLSKKEHQITLLNDGENEIVIKKGEHFAQFVLLDKKRETKSITFQPVRKEESEKHLIIPSTIRHSNQEEYEYVLEDELCFEPLEQKVIATGIKAKIESGTWIGANIHRDLKDKIMFANQTPVIDQDYYENESNDGHCFFGLVNVTNEKVVLPKGTILCVLRCELYYVIENEVQTMEERTGGIGHTSDHKKNT